MTPSPWARADLDIRPKNIGPLRRYGFAKRAALHMSDFHGVRDVRTALNLNRDDSFSSWQRPLRKMSAQFHEEQAGLPRLWQPVGNFGEPPHLLQQFHYSHFGSHKSILKRLIAGHVPR